MRKDNMKPFLIFCTLFLCIFHTYASVNGKESQRQLHSVKVSSHTTNKHNRALERPTKPAPTTIPNACDYALQKVSSDTKQIMDYSFGDFPNDLGNIERCTSVNNTQFCLLHAAGSLFGVCLPKICHYSDVFNPSTSVHQYVFPFLSTRWYYATLLDPSWSLTCGDHSVPPDSQHLAFIGIISTILCLTLTFSVIARCRCTRRLALKWRKLAAKQARFRLTSVTFSPSRSEYQTTPTFKYVSRHRSRGRMNQDVHYRSNRHGTLTTDSDVPSSSHRPPSNSRSPSKNLPPSSNRPLSNHPPFHRHGIRDSTSPFHYKLASNQSSTPHQYQMQYPLSDGVEEDRNRMEDIPPVHGTVTPQDPRVSHGPRIYHTGPSTEEDNVGPDGADGGNTSTSNSSHRPNATYMSHTGNRRQLDSHGIISSHNNPNICNDSDQEMFTDNRKEIESMTVRIRKWWHICKLRVCPNHIGHAQTTMNGQSSHEQFDKISHNVDHRTRGNMSHSIVTPPRTGISSTRHTYFSLNVGPEEASIRSNPTYNSFIMRLCPCIQHFKCCRSSRYPIENHSLRQSLLPAHADSFDEDALLFGMHHTPFESNMNKSSEMLQSGNSTSKLKHRKDHHDNNPISNDENELHTARTRRISRKSPTLICGWVSYFTVQIFHGPRWETMRILPALDGLRTIAFFHIMLGSVLFHMRLVGFTSFEQIIPPDGALSSIPFQFVVSADLSNDTLLLLGGFLAFHTLAARVDTLTPAHASSRSTRPKPHHTNNKSVQNSRTLTILKVCKTIISGVFWKILRTIPLLAFTVGVYTLVLPSVTSGPFWNLLKPQIEACQSYWWSNIFFLNDFIPWSESISSVVSSTPNEQWAWSGRCLPFISYFAMDMQLYLAIAPLAVILYWWMRLAAFVFVIVLLAVSLILSGLVVSSHDLNGTIAWKNATLQAYTVWDPEYAWLYYFKPYTRAFPWILGLFLSMAFHVYVTIRSQSSSNNQTAYHMTNQTVSSRRNGTIPRNISTISDDTISPIRAMQHMHNANVPFIRTYQSNETSAYSGLNPASHISWRVLLRGGATQDIAVSSFMNRMFRSRRGVSAIAFDIRNFLFIFMSGAILAVVCFSPAALYSAASTSGTDQKLSFPPLPYERHQIDKSIHIAEINQSAHALKSFKYPDCVASKLDMGQSLCHVPDSIQSLSHDKCFSSQSYSVNSQSNESPSNSILWYTAFGRAGWAAGLGGMLSVCLWENRGLTTQVLISPMFRHLARLVTPALLAQQVILPAFTFGQTQLFTFSGTQIVIWWAASVFLCLVIAECMLHCIQYPILNLLLRCCPSLMSTQRIRGALSGTMIKPKVNTSYPVHKNSVRENPSHGNLNPNTSIFSPSLNATPPISLTETNHTQQSMMSPNRQRTPQTNVTLGGRHTTQNFARPHTEYADISTGNLAGQENTRPYTEYTDISTGTWTEQRNVTSGRVVSDGETNSTHLTQKETPNMDSASRSNTYPAKHSSPSIQPKSSTIGKQKQVSRLDTSNSYRTSHGSSYVIPPLRLASLTQENYTDDTDECTTGQNDSFTLMSNDQDASMPRNSSNQPAYVQDDASMPRNSSNQLTHIQDDASMQSMPRNSLNQSTHIQEDASMQPMIQDSSTEFLTSHPSMNQEHHPLDTIHSSINIPLTQRQINVSFEGNSTPHAFTPASVSGMFPVGLHNTDGSYEAAMSALNYASSFPRRAGMSLRAATDRDDEF